MKEFLRIAILAVALGLILALIFALQGLVGPEASSFCNTAADCEGLEHEDCQGGWACQGGYCSWECVEPSDTSCEGPEDCEGLPHIMCVGEWACEDGECVWACEAGGEDGKLEYEVSECGELLEEESAEIRPAADGISVSHALNYVCCADIELEAERDGNLISITEVNRGEMCECICSYRIEAELETFPGTYKVELYGVEFGDVEAVKLAEEVVSVGKTNGSVLFIEQHKSTHGRLISGDYPYMFIDFPAYHFHEEERVLEGSMDFGLDGAVALYGTGESLSGDAGSGAATTLHPVYSVPVEASGDAISRIWDDGTVAIDHANRSLTLEPGETWSETSFERTAGPHKMGLIELNVTDTITNHGFISREDITRW